MSPSSAGTFAARRTPKGAKRSTYPTPFTKLAFDS
jgi:hypothetical protein